MTGRALRRLVFFAALAVQAPRLLADTVYLKDGTSLEGRVVRYESEALTLALEGGVEKKIPRSALLRIEFATEPAVVSLQRVELKVFDADDAIEIDVNGSTVLPMTATSDWIPIQGRLEKGNNELRFRVRNDRAGWAYVWALRIGGRITYYRCCEPRRTNAGCREGGHKGVETGVIDDLGSVWLHCDETTGICEIEKG